MSSYGQILLGAYLTALLGKRGLSDQRPDWLDGGELDLFWPELDLAFEFQGHGHFAPVFGSRALVRQQVSDRRKLEACERHGIVLCRVSISGLRHPDIAQMILRRQSACYGRDAGAKRFFAVAGERAFTRQVLFEFNPRFEAYRRSQINGESWRPSVGSAKQRRVLRQSLGS